MSLEFLVPHLARAMPGVASAIPWLLLLGILMIAGATVATVGLGKYRRHLTYEDAQRFESEGRRTIIHDVWKKLSWGRRVLLGLAVFLGITWTALWITGAGGPEWTELVFFVIYGLVFLPAYVVIRVLELAFRYVADRIDQILDQSSSTDERSR